MKYETSALIWIFDLLHKSTSKKNLLKLEIGFVQITISSPMQRKKQNKWDSHDNLLKSCKYNW